MALVDFKLFTDSGLTTEFGGLYQITHQSDLSDNPQDFQLWFGSNGVSNLETTVNPGVDNITYSPVEILPEWAASTAYIVGNSIEPTVQNGFRYVATVAGTSAASEPTFPTGGIGSVVTDGGVTWQLVASTHEPTEIKLAATSGGLAGATAGAALSLGTTMNSGVINAKEINIRMTNAVTDLYKSNGLEELALHLNDVTES